MLREGLLGNAQNAFAIALRVGTRFSHSSF
jgi:hypothetical protein